MPVRLTALVLAFAVLSVMPPLQAWAQDDGCGPHEELTDPVAIFEQGAACFRQGNFAEALVRFERAHALDPDPTLLYNMARAHEGMGDDEKAVAAYKRYLEARPDAPDRGAVGKRIEQLEREMAEPAPVKRPAPEPTPPDEPAIAPWILVGAGVIGVGVGIAFGVVASSTEDEAVAEPDAFQAAELRDEAELSATVANVALIAGSVVAAAGLVWGTVDLVMLEDGEVGVGPGGIWFRGAF